MCGICGELRADGGPGSAAALEPMLSALEGRGPDGDGIVRYGPVALGHRRLKIIDLSTAARQPMVDSELGLGIVYNGAIYNYPELREELRAKGYRFFSTGDTEVLLKAYHAWGEDFVDRLNGMFAFAIHERETGRLLLGRDRLGIKPLYWTESGGRLRFASNVQALLRAGGVDTSIDPVALHYYMTFHSVVPPPHTILQGVRKLPPATLLRIDPDGTRRERVYWRPVFEPRSEDEGLSEEDWKERTLEVLRRAVRRRLVADVPVGVLLSGGIDSSLVVGLLAEAGQRSLNTFSIGFEAVRGEAGDEFRYSDVIADRFATEHHKIFIEGAEALGRLDDCIGAMSEPMVSHDVIGFYLLSREVARHIRVVQSGQGADEIFAGYHWYPPMLESRDPVEDYARVFFDRDHEEFAREVETPYVSEDFSREFVRRHFGAEGARRAVDKALRIDATVMLIDDPVKRVDNTTMAWGLEARVPFLDHEVVELGARTPAELKVRGDGKWILKEAARRVVPADVIDRPKGYFPVPALKYIEGEYLERVRETLDRPAARERGVFRRDYVEQLLENPSQYITPLRGSKLWQIALLERWLQVHGV